jgi:uncharacterized protein (TIGR03067 family)
MDLELLQGAWRAVRIEKGGSPVPEELAATVRYIFDDDRVILMEGDQKAGEGVIRLDPASDPKAFDFTATEGPQKGSTVLGIYRVEGDALTMCLGEERPSQFTGAGEAAVVDLTRIG